MARLVYKLTGQKRSDEEGSGYIAEKTTGQQKGRFQPMPYTRSLPRFHRIVETVNGKKKVRQIAYAPTEDTIYMDEFIDPNAKIVKPKFKNGYLIVDDDVDPKLPEYLAKLDSNASKENRDHKVPVKFIRLDKKGDAEAKLQKEEAVAKELSVFWELPIEKRQAIANSVGIPTQNQEDSIWLLRLFSWAQLNPKDFTKAYNNPDIEYIDTVSRAEKLGILRFDSYTWSYNNVAIMKVAHTKNRYAELASKLLNEPQLERAISNDVNQKLGITTMTVSENYDDVDFIEITSEQLLELAKKAGVVKYHAGKHHEVVTTGKAFGSKSNASAIEAIDNEHLLREMLITEVQKM